MKDKAHTGTIDHTRDHHMINGQLVPVVESRSTLKGPRRSAKGSKRASASKGEVAATGTKAAASRST